MNFRTLSTQISVLITSFLLFLRLYILLPRVIYRNSPWLMTSHQKIFKQSTVFYQNFALNNLNRKFSLRNSINIRYFQIITARLYILVKIDIAWFAILHVAISRQKHFRLSLILCSTFPFRELVFLSFQRWPYLIRPLFTIFSYVFQPYICKYNTVTFAPTSDKQVW